jgi:hypothetical protein
VRLLSESGKSVSEVARDLGIGRSQLEDLKKLLLGNKSRLSAFPGNGNLGGEKKELEELRRELARVKEERENPKKSYGRILTTAVMKYAFVSEYTPPGIRNAILPRVVVFCMFSKQPMSQQDRSRPDVSILPRVSAISGILKR